VIAQRTLSGLVQLARSYVSLKLLIPSLSVEAEKPLAERRQLVRRQLLDLLRKSLDLADGISSEEV